MTFTLRIMQPMLFFISLFLIQSADAYRMGDAIETEILTPKGLTNHEHAPKRSQMPLFGMDTRAKLGPLPDRFSISFEEGFRALPWMTLKNGYGVPLEKVEVTFVYSRSGNGEIHSLQGKAIYAQGGKMTTNPDHVVVEYKWIEEAGVDLNGGAFVVFLAVFIVSIFFLIDLCGLCDNGEDSTDTYTTPSSYVSQSGDPLAMGGMPKYE